MLSELCQELRNWFDRGQPHINGALEISSGKIITADFINVIQANQYFRIVGSVFNDGVYKYTNDLMLIDEVFDGSIWLMAIPKAVLDLDKEIDDWMTKYFNIDSEAMSPFDSESFGGYSYSKSSGGSSGGSGVSWQNVFASKLNLWRKI